MSLYPRYAIAGGNQFPAVAFATPSQLPVIELVDGAGVTITNLGNGPADGTWTNMILTNGWTAGDDTPQYMKNSRGWVFLRGKVVSPGSVAECWTIPASHAAAYSDNFFGWTAGGTDLVNPSTTAILTTVLLRAGFNGSGVVDATVGRIVQLDNIAWKAA